MVAGYISKGIYFWIFHLAGSCLTIATTVNQPYRLTGSLPAQLLTNHRNPRILVFMVSSYH